MASDPTSSSYSIKPANGEGLFELLDSATPEVTSILPGIEEHRKIASNRALPLGERLEAFEDISESEVGDTGLSRARNIEREIGLRQVFLKFEGGNPTGTQKDRIAFAASLAGLRCVIYLPEGYHTKRIGEITQFGAEIERVPGDNNKPIVRLPCFVLVP